MSLKAMFWHKLYFASNVRGVGGYLKLNKLCLLLCSVYLCLGITEAWRNTDVVSCTNAKHIFVNRHVTLEVVEEPITGGVCGIPASCCSSSAGRQLSGMAKKEIEDAMKTQATRLATTLQSRAKRFDEVFRALLAHSKEEFHTMFTRTYGLIYERHAHMFDELFSDLERYHSRGDLDLAKAMDRFFAVLYQKMFVELNAQYHFDDKYLSCVIEHMQELQPFGDIPRKLAVQVKRAFVATRTFTRALVAAADVAHNMANMRSQSSCASLMVKVRWCGACSGISEMACPNFCLNAARACLPLYADISADWDAFVDAMDKVADRLLGPFNIAMVVEPIDIKISEAIMNFQEHSQELSETVFTGCGKPVLGPRPPDTGYFPAGQRLTRSVDYQPYPESKRFNDNSDDFEIETSEESLLKKNPFILSRGSSRKNLLDKHERNEDFKSKMNVNTKVDDNNDLFSEDSEYSRGKNFDKRMVYERLVSGSRNKREADPDPVKNSKEIEFETYDFYSQSQRGNGGRRRGNKKKQGGGKKKNQEVVDETANARPDETSLETGGESRYGPTLDRMVREVRQKVKDTKKIWQRLPQVYCESISAPEAEEKCWNGTHVAKYLPPLAGEGTAALATNPELRGSAAGPVPAASTGVTPAVSLVSTQQFNLKAIIGKLKNAYNGLDVLWTEGEDSAFLTFGSGSSSGDDITDDDDTEESGGPPDQEEGSGHHIPEEPKFPVKEPDQDISEETDTYNPPIVSNNDPDTGIIDENEDIDPEIDERNSIDAEKEQPTGSGADPKEEMSLQRAMITYLFPIVCVWFGGIITDIA